MSERSELQKHSAGPPKAALIRMPEAPAMSERSVAGRWRIVEMELWDTDAIDLLGPAFIEFGTGSALSGSDAGSQRVT